MKTRHTMFRMGPSQVMAVALLFLAGLGACSAGGESTSGTTTGEGGSGAEGGSVATGGATTSTTTLTNADYDGDGYTPAQGDCNDQNPAVHPGVPEICDNGIDDNCNGTKDTTEPDGDGDGYGPCQGDCNDADPTVNPSTPEVPNDGIDNNCDGATDGDYDSDGYTVAEGDCDDFNPEVHPGAIENCFDGLDNDCNGFIDGAEPDADQDGYGPCLGDCDDTNANVNPGMPEVPNDGLDNNCDNLVDEDVDGDGWTVTNGDCNDNNANINPAMLEICTNGVDDDCDGETDTDCVTACQLAELLRSNVGCEYYVVDMDNYTGLADTACFALFVSNTDPALTANVVVQQWQNAPQALTFPGYGATRAIAPGTLEVFRVSGSCSAPGAAIAGDAGLHGTGLGARGALRVVSDVPVVVYQINPFEAANIHTTDASLLIPTPALDKDYYVVSYPQTNPSRGPWDLPASINILATQDNTTVTFTSSTNTRAGGSYGVLGPGQQLQTTLNQFDNLQIETGTTNDDLSGSYIVASAPVAVFAGNQCADVPINSGYCDHLEEELTPLTTWGTQYAGAMHPQRGSEGALWRVVAANDATTINFDPPAVHAPLLLNAGQVVEFETPQDFLATSTDPAKAFFLVQVMLGAERAAAESGTDIFSMGNLRGDPAMTLSVPTAQYLDRYIFLSDPTYAYNWLVVVRSNNADVIHLDCLDPIPDNRFTTIGAGPFQVARITLSAESGGADGTCTSGAHNVWGGGPFGIWVYGVFADTSYGYPGGMNLARIHSIN